jgi:hypothetical protein
MCFQTDNLESQNMVTMPTQDDVLLSNSNRRMASKLNVPRLNTAMDLRMELQQALERGMVKTNYVHAGTC